MIEYTGVEKKLVQLVERDLEELPLLKYLGYELVWLEPGKAIARIKVDPSRHRNPNRSINGGVYNAMADTTTGFAAFTCGNRVCTVSDESQYLHAGKLEGELTCTAQVVKEGRTLIWTEARICDEQGTLLVKSEYLYYRLEPLVL